MYVLIFSSTTAGVMLFRVWSIKNKLLDVPNERSSHTEPTPRGGGLVIVITILFAYVIYSKINGRDYSASYLLGASLIAFISWLDDLFTISFVWRFFVQAIAALLVIYSLGHFREIHVPTGGSYDISSLGVLFTFVWVVWLTNAFNFMDGIDGLAGIEAFGAGIGWLIIGKIAGFEGAALLGGIIAFSSLGFLLQNWFPAKVFMGDVGSAFLGFSFAVLPLIAAREQTAKNFDLSFLPLISASLIWLFLFDTILTFSGRLLRGQKVWQAHREHIYQKLVINGYAHNSVSAIYGAASLLTDVFLIFLFEKLKVSTTALIVFLFFQSAGLLVILFFSKTERSHYKNSGGNA